MSLGLYFDFHFPLALTQFIDGLLGLRNFDQGHRSTPIDNTTREWYSQMRPGSDPTVEVISIDFALPLSIANISVDILRVSCYVEFWYQDRNNNWIQMVDMTRSPLTVTINTSDDADWFTYTSKVYPIVAKSVQIRVNRVSATNDFVSPYPVGLRNTLIKRNIYTRNAGVQYLEDEQDTMGNVISKEIKDWDASLAVDGDAFTYWKSGPMPDPAAVVSLYLDVRDPSGNAQLMDRIYLDPVYASQQMNLYWSNDDTVTDLRLSPISMVPDSTVNAEWQQTVGLVDLVGTVTSKYIFTAAWGPHVNQNAWMGFRWRPDFNSNAGPSSAPILWQSVPLNGGAADQWSPTVSFDPGSMNFILAFNCPGQSPITYTSAYVNPFKSGDVLTIIAGWRYGPSSVFFKVINQYGTVLSTLETVTTTVPKNVTFDGTVSMLAFRGTYTASIIKLSDYELDRSAFLANPMAYVSPNPLVPNTNGVLPSSSLDNAIYSADWTQQQYAIGGSDQTKFTGKLWTPVWRNFIVTKGMALLPSKILAKYLKLEFTNLTVQPYPIYESGIEVEYQVFPVSVQQQCSIGPRLYVGPEVGGLGGVANLNGVKSINWFDPFSVISAVQAVLAPTVSPVLITQGSGYMTTSLPHIKDAPPTDRVSAELSMKSIYRRDVLQPYILAQTTTYTLVNDEGLMALAPYTDIPWKEISDANPGAIATTKQIGAMPVRGTNYWLFPGQQLKVPADVMERITSTSSVTELGATLDQRIRFTTKSIHKYETRTVTRDTAIAYFAGLREVSPQIVAYIATADVQEFDFPIYSPDHWTMTNTAVVPNGAITWDDAASTVGIMTFDFDTLTSFNRLAATFTDSGMLRSNSLWATPGGDVLSQYTSTIPASPDGTMWGDTFKDWFDDSAQWGSPFGTVAINLDPDRQYQGNRAIRFDRAAGAGAAGIALQQHSNLATGELMRLGCTILRPTDNDNPVMISITQDDTKVVVYSGQVSNVIAADGTLGLSPARWVTFTTDFFEVPDGDQNYTLQLLDTGSSIDTLYVSDLYSEIAGIRYYMQAGDNTTPLFEVTALRYIDSAQVVSQLPATHGHIEIHILSDRFFASGCSVVPYYDR